ncbi:hypothetical protein B0H67DRAFT_646588 [Lasiosphaeris hirsuta]|uniref:C2H2-type domain-containing protein n=1 Tax=Lasiosphaeris hirsuta TaxID=260670 RepID=A0AA40A8D9_9PEZI|nr:hypothetical protein B0H67DRAFT_646588 [Lasiosphaeris hirsuta]
MASALAGAGVAAAAAAAATGPQICHYCRKSFPRLCDLNKHAKSHSRPFKCSFTTCKYHEQGWPTAKELERHVNDKHSSSPRTFHCLFPSCSYESKRESNCKQHMEKKHEWKYIRSKSNGKRVTVQPGSHLEEASPITAPGSRINPTIPKPLSMHPFGPDFVLFPDSADHSMGLGEDEDDLGLGYSHPQDHDSQTFIPWTSPTTRMRKNQYMLDTFSQTYSGTPERPITQSDMAIDPDLPRYSPLPAPGYRSLDDPGMGVVGTSVKPEAAGMAMDQVSSWAGGSDTGSTPDDSPSGGRNPSTAYSSQFHTPQNDSYDFGGPSRPGPQKGWTPPKLRRRGSEEDDRRPEKKLKSTAVEEFTDTNMPDIFRFAHPQIYDRDQKEKYSPCHSAHRDISTLVRHLGRPAHRLKVTKETISSFDIEDDDYHHPKIGVCRRCWRQFHDRYEFDSHAASNCEKVSKGKREKWQILYDSFTPLVNSDGEFEAPNIAPLHFNLGDNPEQSRESPSRRSSFFAGGVEDATWDEHASPPTSVPSPAAFFPRSSAPPTSAPGGTSDSIIDERERLQRENNALLERNQQLEKMATALIVRQMYQEFNGAAAGPSSDQLTLSARDSTGPGASAAGRPTMQLTSPGAATSSSKDSSDRDSLVVGMGSQPENVNIQGLMDEPQENLSRQNSGLSSASRSTIHHVTTSPPPLPDDFPVNGEDGADEENHPRESTPNRKPATSIPDSGYDSNHRYGSFGEAGFMHGVHHQGHHRNSSSISTIPYHQHGHHHGTMADGGGPSASAHSSGITWADPFAAPQPAHPAIGHIGDMAPQHHQQHHQNTFMPQEQEAPHADSAYDEFTQFLNLEGPFFDFSKD